MWPHLSNSNWKTLKRGYQVFNYIGKQDLNMNNLVSQVEISLNKKTFISFINLVRYAWGDMCLIYWDSLQE